MFDWNRKNNNFVRARAQATHDVQARIADVWTWSQKTVAQWQTDIAALDPMIADEGIKRLDWYMAHEAFRNNVDKIKDFIRGFKRAGEVKFRHDREIHSLIGRLSNRLSKPRRVYQEGLTARDLWERADETWQFKTWHYTPVLTLADFGAVLEAFPLRENAAHVARAAWLPLTTALSNKIYSLDRENKAWYTAATERFPAGTVEGDLIRSSVPTAPPQDTPVERAVISNLKVTDNEIQFDCAAPGATHYTYLQQAPGSPVFMVVLADTADAHVTLQGQAAGVHRFKAVGGNSGKQGPVSEVVQVTVASEKVINLHP